MPDFEALLGCGEGGKHFFDIFAYEQRQDFSLYSGIVRSVARDGRGDDQGNGEWRIELVQTCRKQFVWSKKIVMFVCHQSYSLNGHWFVSLILLWYHHMNKPQRQRCNHQANDLYFMIWLPTEPKGFFLITKRKRSIVFYRVISLRCRILLSYFSEMAWSEFLNFCSLKDIHWRFFY